MNTEENSGTMEEEDFEPLPHPILSFAQDEFLCSVVERLTSLVDPDYSQEFAEIMKKIVFNDVEMNELKQISFCESTVCSKSMDKNDIYFVCLDCDLNTHPNLYSLLCYECFDKSNHKGHRLYIRKAKKSSSATCDCGDVRSIKPEGFCPNHQFKPINIQDLYENFPQELRVRYERLIKKSIYGAVSLFELKQDQEEEMPEETFDSLSELADDFVSEMLDFWIECYSKVNRAFLPILWMTLRNQFDSPWDLVWHDCGDLRAENKNHQEPHQCTCSLLGNLFRISNLINKENQGKLKKILAECGKDEDFLGHLALEFTKYIRYFFTQDYDPEALGDENSLIWRLYFHVYQGDKILGKVLDSGYFENFLSLIKKVVDDCPRMNEIACQTIFQIKKILEYFLIPTNMSAQRLAKDEGFLLQYIDVAMTFQMKFYYTDGLTTNLFDHQIDYDSINMTLEAEKNLCKSLENALKIIFDLQDEQNETIGQFLKHWYMSLQDAKAALKDEESFDPCLERLFCCVIMNYMKDDISTTNLEKFMKENFDNAHEVAVNTIEGPLRALGMIRYLHLIFNYKSGDIFDIYYSNYNAFFEIDVGITQMMLTLLKPEQGIFELLVENFFSYSPEIQGFFKDPKEENYEKKRLTVIEDFLYFLIFLMNDEICLLNIQSKYQRENFGQIDLNPRQKLVVKDLLVNILRGHYWTTGKEITKISDKFLPPNQEIDEILLEVSVKDEMNQKIRIKDGYEAGLDPYIFYKMPSIRQDIVQTLIEKNNSIDLVSAGGERFESKDGPQFLKNIQIKVYQSNLPEFLVKYLKMTNLKTSAALIRIVLKLILLNIQVAEESSVLREKIKNNYVNDDFLLILENILTEESLKDCKNCVENIKKLLQKFQGNQTLLVENCPRAQKKEDENTKKKLTAQERMEQLKQSFAQKQAVFAQKNESMLQKSLSFEDAEESKKDEHLVCQHCMERLHVSGKEYGLLIYITFTNNFYDATTEDGVFVEQDYSNLLNSNWWPVITSCNHYFHRKCFEICYKAPKKFEKNFLNNAYESFCPLCKGLCNNFLSINGDEAIQGDDINQEVPQEQMDMYPQIYQTFAKKIQKILVDLMTKIQLKHATGLEEASFVPIETIFERAYQYFIESFYLMENPQNLEKSFELYLAFFKGFKTYFKEDPEHKIPEDNIQISAFFNVNNLFLSTQTCSPSNSMNYKTEVFLIELLAKNLQRNLVTSDDDISQKSGLLALKDFILFKVIKTIAFHNVNDSNLKLEHCFQFYRSDQVLRSLILNELVFPIQKIVLSYVLNMKAIKSSLKLSELFDLLCSIPNNQEDYLTNLFKLVNIPCSFPEFILQIFQELPSRPQSEINFLSSLFDHKLFNKEILKPQLIKFAPRMIRIPENYLEFNTHYFPQKCNLCKKYSSHLLTSICLICGEIMCTSYCNNDPNKAGNLNRHSKKYHMGMGVFLDIQHLRRNLVNTPLNLDSNRKSLYLNKIGQDIVSFLNKGSAKLVGKLDFVDFQINQEYLKELIEMIFQQGLRKEIFRVGLKFGEKVENNFL